MRLKERELIAVEIAPRVCVKGALGSLTEAFSDQKTIVRASVLPESRAYSAGEGGLKSGKGLKIIIPKDISVSEGDGVWVNGELYVISFVCRWRAHAELECVKKQ